MKYRKKPVVINAMQYTGNNGGKVHDFVRKHLIRLNDGTLLINTLEGNMKVSIGDYIIRGVEGEFYPCRPNIFEKTYERVE